MNKALLLSLSLSSVALSGCTDDNGAADDLKDEFPEGSGETDGETGTETSGEAGNQTASEEPLEGTMSISFGANQSLGQAPFTVALNILSKAVNADGTEDPNALIDWVMFDAENSTSGLDEFGEGINATAEFTFQNPGLYEIIAGVNADGFESAFATISSNVTDAPVVVKREQIASGTWPASVPIGCALVLLDDETKNGTAQGWVGLEPWTQGGTFTLTVSYTGASGSGAPELGWDILLRDSASVTVGQHGDSAGATVTAEIPETATDVYIRTST
jgi:hypothetical protein